jgi:Tfp pilus assembly protein PilP
LADKKIRDLDGQIQNIRGEIDKTLDNVTAIKTHQEFLYKIFKREDPKWVEDQNDLKAKKKAKIKEEWKKR